METKGYDSYAEAIADGWKYVAGVGWTQSGGGNNDTQDGTGQGQVDPNRTERVQRTGVTAEAIAQGQMPDDLPTIPDAGKIDRTGTELDAGSESFKMQKTGYARASGVADTSKEKVTEGDVKEAGDTKDVTATTMTAEKITDAPEVTAAKMDEEVTTAQVTEGTITKGDAPATVKPEKGSMTELIQGKLSDGATFDPATGKDSTSRQSCRC